MWAERSLGHIGGGGTFVRHLLEMVAAMMVGMMASAAIFLSAVGMTADAALRRHAVLFVVVQAVGMTVAMIAWMRYRGHAWRGCSEMAAAMVVPAIPLIGLRLAGVINGPICGAMRPNVPGDGARHGLPAARLQPLGNSGPHTDRYRSKPGEFRIKPLAASVRTALRQLVMFHSLDPFGGTRRLRGVTAVRLRCGLASAAELAGDEGRVVGDEAEQRRAACAARKGRGSRAPALQ